ncbi:MAG TPA: histidine kinase dimerization/phospho-acceptor domain-containing protein [Pirellulales bacterium]|nr:histidine kinase dimerization/phospho-acceptor domain-containing protein [Pirellulales bacterium]
MTASTLLRLPWPLAVSGLAALLATLNTQLAGLSWWTHFGGNLLALGLVFRLARSWSPARSQNVCIAEARKDRPTAEFLAGARHEVRTPLAGIKAYVELLADGDADDEAVRAEFLTGIGSQVERLERALDGLLGTPRDSESGWRSTPDLLGSSTACTRPIQPLNN